MSFVVLINMYRKCFYFLNLRLIQLYFRLCETGLQLKATPATSWREWNCTVWWKQQLRSWGRWEGLWSWWTLENKRSGTGQCDLPLPFTYTPIMRKERFVYSRHCNRSVNDLNFKLHSGSAEQSGLCLAPHYWMKQITRRGRPRDQQSDPNCIILSGCWK